MFTKSSNQGYQQKFKGVRFKTLVYGEKTLLASIKLSQDAIIPQHKHIHEQTGYLISGRLDFIIEENHFIAEPGDSWIIPGNILHGVEALVESNLVEVFSPVREDYLP